MAASDTSDSNRFVYRPASQKAQPYYIPITRSGSIIKPNRKTVSVLPTPMVIRSADQINTHTEPEPPARRVVVIRTNKYAPSNENPIDLGDFEKSKSLNIPTEENDGHKKLFLIRRSIVPPSAKPIEYQSPLRDPSPVKSLENISTPTPPPSPPPEIAVSPNSPPSPPLSPPPRPKTSKPVDNSKRYIPYLRQPRQRTRVVSPSRLKSTPQSPSPVRTRSKPSKHQSPPLSPPPHNSPKQEEPQEIHYKEPVIPIHSPSPTIAVNEHQLIECYSIETDKNVSQNKSDRSIGVISPDERPMAVIENSTNKLEASESTTKHSKLIKKNRFDDEFKDESIEELLFQSRSQKCLACLARYMCLVIIICLLIILIGLAGVAVSAYFLAINTTNNLIPTVIGISIGGVLVIAALCFLCILLACIGTRDGYFRFHRKSVRSGGRAFAVIPPTHPNANQYFSREKSTNSDTNHRISTSHNTLTQPVTTIAPITERSNKNNIIIEMPEQLFTQRRLSPRTRERSLTNVVRNIGYVVEDAKRRNHGDLPDGLVVKVNKDGIPTV